MGTALRRSASTLEITYSQRHENRSILFLNKQLSKSIQTTVMDDLITSVLGDITQFNKDTGWGKLRMENGTRLVSFNIPYDVLNRIKNNFIEGMKLDNVNLQTYFVRDLSGELTRLIVVGILPTPHR